MNELVLGLVTGILFGALLQQGRVLRFEKQVGAMLLQDMTILKFMLSGIITVMIGINILFVAGVVNLSVKSLNLGAVVIGGLLFGIGRTVMEFCPGTAVGAVGEGRWHATWGAFGKITLPQALGVSPFLVAPFLIAGLLLLFVLFEKKGV